MLAPNTREPRTRAQSLMSSKIGRSFTAIVESDRSKLLQRAADAEAAILERSRTLAKSPASSGKEQDAMTRALHILSLLRAKAGD